MASEQQAAELVEVRRELDELVEQRLSFAFTPTEQRRYDRLLARESELLAEIRAARTKAQRSRIATPENP